MSTLLGDLEQYSAMDLDPVQGLHRSSDGEQPKDTKIKEPGTPKMSKLQDHLDQHSLIQLKSGEPSGIPKKSKLQGDLEQKESIHLDFDGSSAGGSSHGDSSSSSASEQSSQASDDDKGEESDEEEEEWVGDLCHAICENKWNDVKAILDQNPKAWTIGINDKKRTALHVAAMFGHVTIVEELLQKLTSEFLTTLDSEGYTPLTLACWYSGSAQLAKLLVEKNKELLKIPNKNGRLPVVQAFANNYIEMGRYLYPITPLECLTGDSGGDSGSELISFCFKAQCFDIALDLLRRCEELLLVPMDDEGWMPIYGIASLNTDILSSSELILWKRWIYHYINTPSTKAINHVCEEVQQEDKIQGDKEKLTQPDINNPSTNAMNHVCLDIQHEDRGEENKEKLTQQGHGLLAKLINFTYNFVGVNKIQELKLQHAQADALLGLVCKNARKAHQEGILYEALKVAAKEGNAEFVYKISNVYPEVFTSRTFLSCFNEALDNRQATVFNLIHGLQFKYVVLNSTTSGNSMLHKAAMKAPDHILNRIYAPTLQMQRELQWFKEVESLIPPTSRGARNNDGKTAEELFRESHQELMKQGEKWIKSTASSCSVVGALIVTMMFAVAFTVPGGNDQNLGYPLFIKQPIFKVFIFATILSLVSSTTSVLMFLAILTSQYSEDKFLKSLPRKLISGLLFLFISIVCMMIAFLSTIYLILKHTHYSWGILPIIILASIPIFLFGLSQFPLLLHTYVTTYGNIFDSRKVKSWP